ncbi:MAG: HAMP domain-containing protein, partial [Candidatus Marinimicrobia bacterium]|nr:HAMP domain-containing protein [Candidatus Neomarinimicrobiota bacterium]
MSTENQKAIARRVFINEIELYSKFIFFFLTVSVIILFFISFYFITRPLKRLQDATLQLAQGNLTVSVKESKFSPLNDLIISFNTMSQELESNRKKIIQAEKDAAWRDMARILAHEIKNPLTPIRLSLERLEIKYA